MGNLFARVGFSTDAGEMHEEVAAGLEPVEHLEMPLALRDASDEISAVGVF